MLETQLVLSPALTFLSLILRFRSERDDSSFDNSKIRFVDVLVICEVLVHVIFIVLLVFNDLTSLFCVIIKSSLVVRLDAKLG